MATAPKSEADFPVADTPPELNRMDALRGLRIAIWEGSFATIWVTLTTGVFLTGYGLWLGANSVELGLLTAIPTFAGLIQIVSSYFGERLTERRRFTAWFCFAARMLWIPILLLPLVFTHTAVLLPFLLLFTLSAVLINVPGPAYISWMSDLVPANHRGRYFGRRNMIMGAVGMIVGLPAAWFLDFAVKQRHQAAFGFGAIFAVAVLGGIAAFFCLLRQAEPPKRTPPLARAGGLAGLRVYYGAPLADRNFMRLLVFNALMGFGQFFAAPFFNVYSIQILGIGYAPLQFLAAFNSVAMLGGMPLWGYLGDRFGHKPLLVIASVGTITLPFYWIFTTPANMPLALFLVVTNAMASGFLWGGVALTQFNLLIRFSPPEKTPVYVATMAAVTGVVGGVAPLLGGAMMRSLEGYSGQWLGLPFQNFKIVFLTAAVLRTFALFFLRPVVEPEAASARDVIQQLRRAKPRAWRHIRDLQRSSGEDSRLRAASSLADSRTRLAIVELEKALTDPSQAVRTEAARALGEIGDPEAVAPLAAALDDPAAGLREEAARALGCIGDRRANPALIALLRDDGAELSPAERAAVIETLGTLGGAEAATALLAELERSGSGAGFETLVRALGQTGDRRAASALIPGLQSHPARSVQTAIVRALGELADSAAAIPLRNLLREAGDDAVLLPALADALARLSDTESLIPLLNGLDALSSTVARKQVAAAVGCLIGEGEAAYSLLATDEFGRDAAVARLAQDVQKRGRDAGFRHEVAAALEAYVSGDYARCLQNLGDIAETLPAVSGESARYRLCRRTLQYTARSQFAPVETVLLAFAAFRSLAWETAAGGTQD